MSSKLYSNDNVTIQNDDVAKLYQDWAQPRIIISDGAYGVTGFKGDTHQAADLPEWYEPHVKAWSRYASAGTTLWFWNTEVGWATMHPILLANGWDYVACNIWNKGLQHIAGNCNLPRLKNFPLVTEVCVQYVRRAEFSVQGDVVGLKEWIRYEWDRSGLPLYRSNEACGVKNAASRKYLTKDHLWYAPPPEHFERLAIFANQHGKTTNMPYFSINEKTPMSVFDYANLFAKFDGIYGVTNVWDFPPLHSKERIRVKNSTKYMHLNQKPISITKMLIETTTDVEDIVWEPFGGLCTGAFVAQQLGRKAVSAEIHPDIFAAATNRFRPFDNEETGHKQELEFAYA